MNSSVFEQIEPGTYTFIAGKYGRQGKITIENGRYYFDTPYCPPLQEQIKHLANRKYHGFDEENSRKVWSAPINKRNNFQIRRMLGKPVFALYDKPLGTFAPSRPLFIKQELMANHMLTHKRCLVGGEMGTGKTLAAIEAMERSGKTDWWWVGPKSALAAVELEFRKWKSRIRPEMMTYERMTKLVNSGEARCPDGVVMDESSKVKTPTAKRTLAAMNLCNYVIDADGYVFLMSGTPAPKSPLDWWAQTEICCPGFLIEGTIHEMKATMAYVKQEEGLGGNSFPRLIGWKDTTKRCGICGEFENHIDHSCYESLDKIKLQILAAQQNGADSTDLRIKLERAKATWTLSHEMHKFTPGVNEVERLYKRLSGLVEVVFKKDCIDLPDKFYRIVECEPSKDMKNASNAVKQIERRGATALMKLRQISDGFLYTQKEIGRKKCFTCDGSGKISYWWSEEMMCHVPEGTEGAEYKENVKCPDCHGKGDLPDYVDDTVEITSPKEEALRNLLDEMEEVGRIVVSAGFTASLDKCINIVTEKGWDWIRVDGRGWKHSFDGSPSNADLLEIFQGSDESKVAFIMHPESGGMGLTLTASPMMVFYSNDFKAENRMQAEDRIHRPGMDTAKGASIVDLICLDTDQKILDNLQKKRDLQLISMGELREVSPDEERTT